jgi:ribosomal 30S subunit maturation factor RimM
MTSSNPQEQAPQTVVENIDAYLMDGMPVYDLNGDKVGDVKMFSTAAGYLMVGRGSFEEQDLYVPFRLIRSIDPHDIFVSETNDNLKAHFTNPPKINTIVENRLVTGPAGTMTSQPYEVQTIASGYDGKQAELGSVNLDQISDRLAVGMAVYDVDGVRVGDITQYDTSRSLMVVEKGIFKPRALLVPFSAIQDIDLGTFAVSLSLPRDVLVKEHAMLPGDA